MSVARATHQTLCRMKKFIFPSGVICTKAIDPYWTRSVCFPSHSRAYASKSKAKTKSSADLVSASQQAITSEEARNEFHKAEDKMRAAVDWYRKEVSMLESRANGRVTPALLSPVKIELPGRKGELLGVQDISTVGVKEGNTLVISVYEEQNLKSVETALYSAKIPGVVPHRVDARTIKISIPRPTVEDRTNMTKIAQKTAEDIRVQVRKVHQTSLKKGKYEKHSVELEQFQKLADRNIAEIDKIFAQMKKTTGSR